MILFQKDPYFLNRRGQNKDTLDMKSHIFSERLNQSKQRYSWDQFIHEMLPTALICRSKTPKVLMQSDMPLGLRSSAKKGTVISSIQEDELSAQYRTAQSTKFAPRSVDLIIGRTALKFSLIYGHH